MDYKCHVIAQLKWVLGRERPGIQRLLEGTCRLLEVKAASGFDEPATFLNDLVDEMRRDTSQVSAERLLLLQAALVGHPLGEALAWKPVVAILDALRHGLLSSDDPLLQRSFFFVLSGFLRSTSATITGPAPSTETGSFLRNAMEMVLSATNKLATTDAGCYLLASATKHVDQSKLVDFLHSLAMAERSALLEAAFCDGTKLLDPSQLEQLLETLLTTTRQCTIISSSTRAFHAFQLIVESVGHVDDDDDDETKNKKRKEILADRARFFFLASLQLLVPRHGGSGGDDECSWLMAVRDVVHLLLELTRHKDVINIRERDLALILAHLSKVMHASAGTEIPDQVYLLCNELLLALIQRFPNQICVCVPTFIGTVHVLWKRVLSSSLSHLAADFGRLAERMVPHNTFFKKHVIGLLLDFVKALSRADMVPARKSALTPAVYSLLDILSTFELKSLNSMMDPPGRAVFRPFYQVYQKQHVYKGQY